jgi:hypothetical protein
VLTHPGGLLYEDVTPITLHRAFNMSSLRRYMTRTKSATLNLRIDPKIKVAAEKAAAEDRRSLTSLVEKLLTEYLRANGYLKK